jgi:hypothetical protein
MIGAAFYQVCGDCDFDLRLLEHAMRKRTAIALLAVAGAHAEAQSMPALHLVSDVRIDAADHDLSPISWLLVSNDGTIAVSQAQDHNIRFFSRSGVALGSFGRKGQGPGEFVDMTLAGWVGDTLWVGDFSTQRITLIAPGGTLVRSHLWPQGARAADASRPVPKFIATPIHGFYGDGSVAVIAIPSSDPIPAWMKQPPGTYHPFLRVRKDGVVQHVIIWGYEWDNWCRVAGSHRPLCFLALWTVSRRGGVFATAKVERSEQANDFVRVIAVRENGDTIFTRLVPVRRERVPAAVRDSVKRVFENAVRKATRAPVDPVDIPEVYAPFVQGLVANDEKTVWFEKGIAVGEREWLVVDRSGQPVASVRVPRRLDLKVVSMDRVWAIERDADGLESIVVFRVQR